MIQSQYKILSVGGSIIIPKTGFDIPFLKQFRELILKELKNGQKFILVIGGGATCRYYNDAIKSIVKVSNDDLDWMGIKTTILNAQFVKTMFKGTAHDEVVTDPTKKVTTNKKLIIAAGWKPGCSTDHDAVLLAKTYGAKEVINLSNIDYVYDRDPKLNPKAKKIEHISWKNFRKIIGSKWSPGANVPFDPTAAKEAERLKLTVKFMKGTSIEQVRDVLGSSQKIAGTIIF